VPIASRTQCSLTCVDGAGLGVETSRVHKPMRRQLGAFRACTLGGGGREAERQILIQFGAGGAATVRYDTSTRHTAGLAECVDRIPLPALAGPPGERWRCSDHCD
jgi:hypothetical protein